MTSSPEAAHIGTLAEKSLHAALKAWLAQPGDRLEARVDGYVIDLVRGDLLIEIQTRGFAKLKRKLAALLERGHRVRLVYPLPAGKWIVRQAGDGTPLGQRKSPKRGRAVDAFRELVRIPHILPHPNFAFHILFTHQEEIWRDDGRGSWRRKRWSLHDHRLLEVVVERRFDTPGNYLALLPPGLPQPFSNRELAAALRISLSLAGKMTYTLCKMGVLQHTGKRRNAYLYGVRSKE